MADGLLRTPDGQVQGQDRLLHDQVHDPTDGQANPDPVVYDIQALKTTFRSRRVPQARRADDQGAEQRPGRARDGGLRRLRRQGGHAPRKPRDRDLKSIDYLEKVKPVLRFSKTETLNLAALKVKPGSKIQYFLTVRDTKEPEANKVETSPQVIEVVDPLPERELAARDKLEEQQQPPQPMEDEAPLQPQEPAETDQPRNDQGKDERQRDANQDPQRAMDPRINERESPDTESQAPKTEQEPPLSPEDQEKLRKLQQSLGGQPPRPPADAGPHRNCRNNHRRPPVRSLREREPSPHRPRKVPTPPSQKMLRVTADLRRKRTLPPKRPGPRGTTPPPPSTAPNPSDSPQVARANPNNAPGRVSLGRNNPATLRTSIDRSPINRKEANNPPRPRQPPASPKAPAPPRVSPPIPTPSPIRLRGAGEPTKADETGNRRTKPVSRRELPASKLKAGQPTGEQGQPKGNEVSRRQAASPLRAWSTDEREGQPKDETGQPRGRRASKLMRVSLARRARRVSPKDQTGQPGKAGQPSGEPGKPSETGQSKDQTGQHGKAGQP